MPKEPLAVHYDLDRCAFKTVGLAHIAVRFRPLLVLVEDERETHSATFARSRFSSLSTSSIGAPVYQAPFRAFNCRTLSASESGHVLVDGRVFVATGRSFQFGVKKIPQPRFAAGGQPALPSRGAFLNLPRWWNPVRLMLLLPK